MALELLCGNESLKQSLSAALAAGRLAHSVLLCGEAGTGAGFAARCLAADDLYPQGGEGAKAILEGRSPEVLVLEGSGAMGDIKIDDVRAVRREVYNTALSAGGRVVLVRGAHKLNASSANALLKVIEEPPAHVRFVLTAPGEAAVLPTIRSRCCVYSLAPVSEEACAAWLAKRFPAEKDAPRLAAIFGGKIGSAKKCIEDPAARAALADALKLAAACEKQDCYAALALLAKVEKDRAAAGLLLDMLCSVCAAALRGGEVPVSPARAAAAIPAAGQAARFALFAFVFTGNDHYGIAGFYMYFVHSHTSL